MALQVLVVCPADLDITVYFIDDGVVIQYVKLFQGSFDLPDDLVLFVQERGCPGEGGQEVLQISGADGMLEGVGQVDEHLSGVVVDVSSRDESVENFST
jgi:hypothetical protein